MDGMDRMDRILYVLSVTVAYQDPKQTLILLKCSLSGLLNYIILFYIDFCNFLNHSDLKKIKFNDGGGI